MNGALRLQRRQPGIGIVGIIVRDIQKIEISDEYGQYTVSRLALSEDQVREFYHITSKEAFWPILHAFKERYNYDPVDWENFRDVNRRFAEAAAEEAAEGALVWVHDYNLWLVPGYLRKLRPDVRILFGHWSTLQVGCYGRCFALDGGCVWGGHLVALRVDFNAEDWFFVDSHTKKPIKTAK